MFLLFLNRFVLILNFGKLDLKHLNIKIIFLMEFVMVLILVGIIPLYPLMLIIHILKIQLQVSLKSQDGLSNVMHLAFYLDHLQMIIVLSMMYILVFFLLFLNRTLFKELYVIYRILIGAIVSMIVYPRIISMYLILLSLRLLNLYMIWVMMQDYGLLMRKRHFTVFQLNLSIGNTWVLNGLVSIKFT